MANYTTQWFLTISKKYLTITNGFRISVYILRLPKSLNCTLYKFMLFTLCYVLARTKDIKGTVVVISSYPTLKKKRGMSDPKRYLKF